ncbi:Uncharacterised protein [Vibrio cholerae]|nr:Uncharacterised protein [Vibrio cholerae]
MLPRLLFPHGSLSRPLLPLLLPGSFHAIRKLHHLI